MGSKGGKGMGKSAGLSATSSLNSELNTAIVSLGAVVLVAGISLFAVRKQRKSKGYTVRIPSTSTRHRSTCPFPL